MRCPWKRHWLTGRESICARRMGKALEKLELSQRGCCSPAGTPEELPGGAPRAGVPTHLPPFCLPRGSLHKIEIWSRHVLVCAGIYVEPEGQQQLFIKTPSEVAHSY